ALALEAPRDGAEVPEAQCLRLRARGRAPAVRPEWRGRALHVPGFTRGTPDTLCFRPQRLPRNGLPLQPGRPRLGVLLDRRSLRLRALGRNGPRATAEHRQRGLPAAQSLTV